MCIVCCVVCLVLCGPGIALKLAAAVPGLVSSTNAALLSQVAALTVSVGLVAAPVVASPSQAVAHPVVAVTSVAGVAEAEALVAAQPVMASVAEYVGQSQAVAKIASSAVNGLVVKPVEAAACSALPKLSIRAAARPGSICG